MTRRLLPALRLALIGMVCVGVAVAAPTPLTVNGVPVLVNGTLLSVSPAAGAPGGALTLADFPAGAIIQRAPASTVANTYMRVSYTGTPLSGMQVQVVGYRSPYTIAVDWTDVSGLTCASGSCVGRLSVPQGGPYRARYRDKYVTGTVVEGTSPWGVGIVVVYAGQSDNLPLWGGSFWSGAEASRYLAGEQYLGAMFTDVGWSPLDRTAPGTWAGGTAASGSGNSPTNQSASSQEVFARLLSAANGGIPVGLVPRWNGGTQFHDLFEVGGTYYGWWASLATPGFQNQPSGIYGDVEQFYLSQGGSDANTSSDAAAWPGKLAAFYSTFLGWTGRTAAQQGFFVEAIKGGTQTYNDTIRQAQLQFVATQKAAGAKVETFGTMTDLPAGTVDLSLGTDTFASVLPMARIVQTGLWATGHATFSGRGAKATAAVRSGSTVVVTVTHDAGTALLNGSGSGVTGAVTGFAFSNNSDLSAPLTPTSVAISSTNQVTATFASAPAGPVYVGYMRTNQPVITNALYDNAVVAATNPGPMIAGQAASGGTLGLPVQPTLGVLTAP